MPEKYPGYRHVACCRRCTSDLERVAVGCGPEDPAVFRSGARQVQAWARHQRRADFIDAVWNVNLIGRIQGALECGCIIGRAVANCAKILDAYELVQFCLLYTSPSPRDQRGSRMPSSA